MKEFPREHGPFQNQLFPELVRHVLAGNPIYSFGETKCSGPFLFTGLGVPYRYRFDPWFDYFNYDPRDSEADTLGRAAKSIEEERRTAGSLTIDNTTELLFVEHENDAVLDAKTRHFQNTFKVPRQFAFQIVNAHSELHSWLKAARQFGSEGRLQLAAVCRTAAWDNAVKTDELVDQVPYRLFPEGIPRLDPPGLARSMS